MPRLQFWLYHSGLVSCSHLVHSAHRPMGRDCSLGGWELIFELFLVYWRFIQIFVNLLTFTAKLFRYYDQLLFMSHGLEEIFTFAYFESSVFLRAYHFIWTIHFSENIPVRWEALSRPHWYLNIGKLEVLLCMLVLVPASFLFCSSHAQFSLWHKRQVACLNSSIPPLHTHVLFTIRTSSAITKHHLFHIRHLVAPIGQQFILDNWKCVYFHYSSLLVWWLPNSVCDSQFFCQRPILPSIGGVFSVQPKSVDFNPSIRYFCTSVVLRRCWFYRSRFFLAQISCFLCFWALFLMDIILRVVKFVLAVGLSRVVQVPHIDQYSYSSF